MNTLYNKLLQKKQEIDYHQKALDKAKKDYTDLTLSEAIKHKKNLAIKYMQIWDKSGKFPLDSELTDLIFFLAGDTSIKQPKIELKFDNNTCIFTLYYFNERLQTFVKVE